jgi:hypothetical protein
MLKKLNIRGLRLPNPNGLSRRLSDARFHSFTYLKTDTPEVPELKRTARRKPIGFFVPD